MTNTYECNLCADVPLKELYAMLQKARADLRAASGISKNVSVALDLRLELRVAFLRSMELYPLRKSNPESLKMPWIQMSGLIEHIKKQHNLAKDVPEAFSTKLQRRLASTMPPRPIIQPSFDDTYTQFKQMFQDGRDVMDVLKYVDPQSLLVGGSISSLCFSFRVLANLT